jgi:sulfofructose kinase
VRQPRTTHPALRVACVGHASLDLVFEVDALPAPGGGKTLAHHHQRRAGGMSLHAAIAAARLGTIARLLGRVGNDDAARFLRARLAAAGVQSAGLESVRGAETSCAAVIVDARGERQIVIHRGDALLRAHALDTRQLAGAQVVLTDPRWPDGAAAALAWAREHDVPSLLDADVAPPEVIDRLLPLARWVAFSEPGLAAWRRAAAGTTLDEQATDDALRHARTRGPALALVTLGAVGARWIDDGSDPLAQAVPAPEVKALDTTGAGDVFHAALAIALAEGRPSGEAVAWACAAAAYKCRTRSGAEGAPTRGALAQWMLERAPATAVS